MGSTNGCSVVGGCREYRKERARVSNCEGGGPQAPRPWEKRRRRDLTVELPAPPARDRGAAFRTAAFAGNAIAAHEVTRSLDQQRRALMAPRVLQIADAARHVAGVDVAQA